MTAIFSQTGGARVGKFDATWPFAKLSANSVGLTLSCLGKEYVFERSRIKYLTHYRGLLSTGLRIEHDVSFHPDFVVFWTPSYPMLKSQLESLGYEFRD